MAIMFPKEPKPETQSAAEKFLFEKMRSQLPDDYQIYHSVAWQLPNRDGHIQDGETDFVIIDPFSGILILEVKGGKKITFDGRTSEWRSNGNLIDDPFAQGKKAKYSLLGRLSEILGQDVSSAVRYAVAFPEVQIKESIRLDAPRAIILDANDIDNLSQWFKIAFQRMSSDPMYKSLEINDDQLKKLQRMFAPSWEFSPPQQKYFEDVDVIIKQLTEDQYRTIDLLQRYRRAKISGCAGSGKTLVAVEKAIRLDREGFKVLILCFNPYLAANLRQRVQGTDIVVADLTGFIHSLISNIDKPDVFTTRVRSKFPTPWTQYDEPTSDELELAFDILLREPANFDAVIVDEGQDFREGWWMIAEACLRDPQNGIFYIFYDDNQLIYPLRTNLQFPIHEIPFQLSLNCRNAGKIFELVQKLHPDAPKVNEQLVGKGVFIETIYSGEGELLRQLREAFRVLENDSPRLKDFVVITAETSDCQRSKFNGFIVDSLDQSASSPKCYLKWQDAVTRYLRPYGLMVGELSAQPWPNEKDIRIVASCCSLYSERYKSDLRKDKSYWDKYSLEWTMDHYGELFLHWKQDKELEIPGRDKLAFFKSPNWAKSLPPGKLRYRLTPINDQPNYPDFVNVQLTDIPSYKGLEAKGVIFVNYNSVALNDDQLRASLYVALSRARGLLYVITPFSIQNKISELSASIN
jgi:hypothetical protein